MTDESQTVEAVVAHLLAKKLIEPGDTFLARLIAQTTVEAFRADGHISQFTLPIPGARGGVWH